MTKKEKIIVLTLAFSMFLITASALYTIFYNKPESYKFRVERFISAIKSESRF